MGNLRMRLPTLLSLAALVSAVVALILAIGACRQPAAEVVVVDQAGRVRVRLGRLSAYGFDFGIALYDAGGRERAALVVLEDREAAYFRVGSYRRADGSSVTLSNYGHPSIVLLDQEGHQHNLTAEGSVTFSD